MEYKVKFAHGLKANVANAISNGKIDADDFIVFSDTNDELAFITKDLEVKPIKARTNEDYILTDVKIGRIPAGFTVPAGTSIDDLVRLLQDWIKENTAGLLVDAQKLEDAITREEANKLIEDLINNALPDYDTLGEISDWIIENQDAIKTIVELQPIVAQNTDDILALQQDVIMLQEAIQVTDWDEIFENEQEVPN